MSPRSNADRPARPPGGLAVLTPGLLAAFAAIVVVLVAARVISTLNLRNVYAASEWVAHTHAVKDSLRQILSAALDAETGERGFIITGSASYLEPYDRARSTLAATIAQARAATADNREQQPDFDRLTTAANAKLAELAEAIRRRETSGFAAAQAVVETNVGKRTMDEMRAVVARMETREDVLLSTGAARAAQSYRSGLVSGFSTTGLALLAIVALFSVTRRLGAERLRTAQMAERLNVTLKSIGDAVITTDEQGRVVRLNAVAETLTGWKEVEALGRRLEEVFVIIDEETRRPADSPIGKVVRENVVAGLANHTVLISKDGREIPVDDSAAPIRAADGSVTGVVLVFRDISGRRQVERQRAAQLEQERAGRVEAEHVARELRQLQSISDTALGSLDFDLLIRELLRRVRGALHSDTATMLLLEPDGRHLIPAVTDGLPEDVGQDIRIPVGQGAAGRIAVSDRALVIDDLATIAVISPILRDRVKSLVGAPLKVGDRLIGVLHTGSTTLRLFSESDARLLTLAAHRVALAIDRARAKAALHDSEKRFRSLVEDAPFGIYIVDSEFRIAQMNAVSQSGAFRNVRPVIGRDFAEATRILWPEPVAAAIIAAFRHTLNTGEAYYSPRFTNPRHDVDAVESYEWELHRVTSTDRRYGVICYYFDSTRLREAEGREQTARMEIERASRMKDDFLAVLSHELRTPLNAVLGYSNLLSSGVLPAERVNHALDAIQRNAQTQARMVESLLDLSRVMAGKLELNLDELNVSTLVNAAVDALHPDADARGVNIDVVVRAHINLVGDGPRLQQVLWNLLYNAVKFTPRDGNVRIDVTEESSQVRIQVADTGQGIHADLLPHVFDRFKQGEDEKRRAPRGLGLGLALVRELVQAHGGTVVAESDGEGHGSTFTVMLPVSPPGVAGARTTRSDQREPVSDSLPPIEILVVDDDADARDFLTLLLESKGARTRTVSSAQEAFEIIRHDRPDLLLADIRMPDEDGLSLIRRVRAWERELRDERLPAIAVTAYASGRDREEAIGAGYDSHIAKPIDPEELTRAIVDVATPENA